MDERRGISNGFASEQAIGSKSPGEKRNGNGLGEGDEFGSKRVKVRDLVSGFAVSDEATTSNLQSVRNIEIVGQANLSGEEKYGVTEIPVAPDADGLERLGREKDAVTMDSRPSTARVVLETSTCCVANTNSISIDDNSSIACCGKQPLLVADTREDNNNHAFSRELSLDLNVDDISSLDKLREISESRSSDRAVEESDSLQGCKKMEQNGLLECPVSEKAGPLQLGSVASPLGESDSMRRWREMKRNGFLSGPLGGAAVSSSVVLSSGSAVLSSPEDMPIQKQQKSKRKGDCLKKKKELPKREQVDRFSSIAAPSGLLKELNPGIINHVRNKKQVRSIIEALVRIGTEDVAGGESHVDSNMRGIDYSHFSHEEVSLAESDLRREHLQSASDRSSTIFEGTFDSRTAESVGEDGKVPFKFPSTETSENASSITNVESANFTSPTSLIVEAATVASQWLELLNQDISGRLSALQHSRNRVQNILTTELPLLASREFPPDQENTPRMMMNTSSGDGFSDKTMMDAHQTRWIALFDQINKALSDEERDLECWLNQVKEMQSHCSEGMRYMDMASTVSSQSCGVSDIDSRSGRDGGAETSLAIQAAAASIYSTCSFLLSTRNSTCF